MEPQPCQREVCINAPTGQQTTLDHICTETGDHMEHEHQNPNTGCPDMIFGPAISKSEFVGGGGHSGGGGASGTW